MTDDEFLAQILMVLCFVPIVTYLLLTAWERWGTPRYRRAMIFRAVSARANQRVLR
jgi:hypothetical protein